MTDTRLLDADDGVTVTHAPERHFQALGWVVDCVHDGVAAPVAARNDDEATVIRCLDLGANDFLQKPVDTRELEIRAVVHLRRAAATRPPAAS